MATTRKWVAPAAIATALTTELNNLANGAYSAASTAIDNRTTLYPYIWFEVYLGSLTPTAGGYIGIYIIPSLDETNYADGGGAVAPAAHLLLCTLDLSTSAGVKRKVTKAAFECPPMLFSLVLYNASGVALAATTNTLKYRMGYEQAV